MKTWAKAALLGGTPFVVMSWGAARLSAQDETSDARSMLAAAVIVGSVMAASTIYDLDSWSLKRQTAAHFTVMAFTVLPALCLSGWFPTQSFFDYVVIAGYFVVTGLVIWSLVYLIRGVLLPRIKNRASAVIIKQ